jgi:hypothetical protein
MADRNTTINCVASPLREASDANSEVGLGAHFCRHGSDISKQAITEGGRADQSLPKFRRSARFRPTVDPLACLILLITRWRL